MQWEIVNPFLPRRRMVATFHYGFPWQVIFEPKNRGIYTREFTITLIPNFRLTKVPNVIVVHNLEINLFYSTNPIIKKIGDTQLSSQSPARCRYQQTLVMPEVRCVHELHIQVEFELTRENIGVTSFHYSENDLWQLSKDMRKVRNDNENKKLKLWSANEKSFFYVHYYIIRFRWSNFLDVHLNQDKYDVKTNISHTLLRNLITYMYCGDFPFTFSFMQFPMYATELCQVVARYRLEHLYKVLVKNDLKQYRMTVNKMYADFHVFRLVIVENRATIDPVYTREVKPDLESKITFKIRLGSQAGNWLSYSLHSECSSKVAVEVNLEFVRKEEGAPETTFPFHGQDQVMQPGQTLEFGHVLFLGCPETFGNYSEEDTQYSIRCVLNVSHGRKAEFLTSIDTREYRCPNERYEVLSDHMRDLFKQILFLKRYEKTEKAARMTVSSHPVFRELAENDCEMVIHKEIFKARVPHENGWKGIRDVTEGPLPDRVVCNLGPFALEYLLEYIYTGKLLIIPALGIKEIAAFAKLTDMESLQRLIEDFIAGKKREIEVIQID